MSVDIDALVRRSIAERIREKGLPVPELKDDTLMLGGDLPIDSLDVATILIELQGETGYDPFADGFIEFRSIGELVALYRAHLG
jgi:acyl carrier protein